MLLLRSPESDARSGVVRAIGIAARAAVANAIDDSIDHCIRFCRQAWISDRQRPPTTVVAHRDGVAVTTGLVRVPPSQCSCWCGGVEASV